jgi:hypothetical protein
MKVVDHAKVYSYEEGRFYKGATYGLKTVDE